MYTIYTYSTTTINTQDCTVQQFLKVIQIIVKNDLKLLTKTEFTLFIKIDSK